jgi:4-hydroxymandelate oxidase
MDAGDTDPRSGPLRVVGAARRTFGGFSDLAFDPRLRVFLTDLVRPFDLALRDDLLDNGAGHSYGEMAAEVIREAVPEDAPVDLLVMAFGIHDIRLGRSTASYLSEICPGDAMAFAVCDQGAAAAFTALRLIGEYGRSGVCERAVLVVVEQSALHYQPASPAQVPERHSAVAVLFEQSVGGNHTVVRQHADVSPQLAGALLADDVAALSAGRHDVTLVLGNGLIQFGHTYLADRMVIAPAGQPYTGPWWELAGGLTRWQAEGRLVLLAEYEPALRYLSLSAVDFSPSPMAVPLAVPVAVPGKQWTS